MGKKKPRSRWAGAWPYLIIAGVVVLVYGQTTTFGFTNLDDKAIILDNYATVGHLSNISRAFTTDAFLQPHGPAYYRPMQTVSFMFDAAIGGPRPSVYHATNVLLHLLTCCLLYALLSALRYPSRINLFLSLLFAVNPLFTHAVAWVPSRGDLLITCFGILAFLEFLEYREKGRWRDLAGHGIALLLAVFSKETALLIPLVCVVYAVARRQPAFVARRDGLLIIAWCVPIGLYLAARSWVLAGHVPATAVGLVPFLKNLPIFLVLLGKAFVPLRLSTMPTIDPISVVIGGGVAIALGLLAAKSRGLRWSVVVFAGAWYLVFLAPTLLFRNRMADVAYDFFDHRAYLPSVGLVVLLAELALVRSGLLRRPRAGNITLLVMLIYAALSVSHARAYRDGMAFSTAAVRDNPRNAMAYHLRGQVEYLRGDVQSAMADISKAISIAPDYAEAYYNRAGIYGQMQVFPKALADYNSAIQYDTTRADFYFNRSAAKWFLRDFAGALVDCDAAIRRMPELWVFYYHRGKVEIDLGRPADALADFNTALSRIAEGRGYNDARIPGINNAQTRADLYVGRAKAGRLLSRPSDAVLDCDRALAIDRGNAEAYCHRGLAKSDLGDAAGAIEDLGVAVSLNPSLGLAWHSLGELKFRRNDRTGACEDWKRASRLGYQAADSLIARFCRD
jgi:tetratricopeptide (TPR) repeat protein